jgi:large subunit ribosomal protein L20
MNRATFSVARKAKRNEDKKLAKGFRGRRRNCNRIRVLAIQKSMQYAYIHRKHKKANFRQLWIQRISAALRPLGINYSSFINIINKRNAALNGHANDSLNRKVLATMAYHDINSFNLLANQLITDYHKSSMEKNQIPAEKISEESLTKATQG